MKSIDAASTAEISLRQLNYWTQAGYIHAKPRPDGKKGSGFNSEYEPHEISVLLIMSDLVGVGFNVSRAAEIARAWTESGELYADLGRDLVLADRRSVDPRSDERHEVEAASVPPPP